MRVISARFLDPAHKRGVFTLDDGREVFGPLPPNAGDLRAVYDVWIAAGNQPEPFAPPAPEPVLIVSAAQAKVALFRRGLLDQVETAVAAYPRDVQIWYMEAREWDRFNPYVIGIGLELGLDDAAMDELFTYASGLAR